MKRLAIYLVILCLLASAVWAGLDAADGKVINVADPTAEQDAATKIWVETQISDANGTTQETVQDWIWSASSIGTTTLIVLTYDDTNNEIDFVVDEASIDHDALTNFVSGEHFLQSAITEVGTIATGVWNGTVLTVPYGGTGASTLTDGGILLGSGTGAITALGVLADGSIVIGDGTTDPTSLAAFTSSTGQLKHESGGLEADVSAYTGLLAVSGGSTAEVDALSELQGQIADVTAFVVEGTACSDIEGTGLSIAAGTLNWACPADTINDTHIDLGVGANQVSGSDMPNEDLGDISVSGGSWTLDDDVVAAAEMADGDYGDFTFSAGSATLDTDSVADNEIDYTAVTLTDFTDDVGYLKADGSVDLTADWTIADNNIVLTNGTLTANILKATGNGLIWSDGTTGTTPASGAGTRLMWIPAKKAFRAGYVSAEQWDNANIGTSSMAMGYDANASGNYSTAIGYTLTAGGYGSTAIGFGADAIGNYSVAIGHDTTASGSLSTTLGSITTASGNYSTAIGFGSTASGDYSTAMGYDTTASGDNSTSMGKDTNSASYISVALGRFNVGGGTTDSWVATDPLFEIGIGADADNLANALTVLKNGNTTINGNLTLATTKNFTLGTTQWDDGSDKIEGNILANDSVDDDAIDFTSITLADFTDDLGADSGHTHTTTTISDLDISDDTNLAAGTNITLSGDTLNVDDAFIVNDGDDETSGNLRFLTNKALEFRNANTALGSPLDGVLDMYASNYFVLDGDVILGSHRFFNNDIFDTLVINAITLDHTIIPGFGTPTTGMGTGLSFKVEDLGGSEEQGSIDVVLTDVTDGSEDADMVFSLNKAGTITEIMRLIGADGSVSMSGSLVVDTDTLVVDAVNHRVGIGTNAPDSIFHIKANVAGTVGSHPAGQLIIQDPDDTVFGNAVITGYESDGAGNPDQQLWYLGSSSSSNSAIIFLNRRNSKLQLGTNDVSRLTILGNGNVGIGETAPQDKLEVNGTVLVKDALKFTQDDGNEYIDSLNDGYMDYGATTGHRFNNDVVVTGDVNGATVDTDEIFNAGGDLKIMPDVQGDAVFFGDTDVNDLANGGIVYIYRKAAEGDAHLSIYIDQYNRPQITGGAGCGDFLFRNTGTGADFHILADDGDVQLQGSAAGDVVIFRDAADGENRSVKQAGYITDGADEVEIMWTVKDTDDYFHLERENTKILGFKIDMPVVMPNLPVADPSVAGALWNDSGTLKISAG